MLTMLKREGKHVWQCNVTSDPKHSHEKRDQYWNYDN